MLSRGTISITAQGSCTCSPGSLSAVNVEAPECQGADLGGPGEPISTLAHTDIEHQLLHPDLPVAVGGLLLRNLQTPAEKRLRIIASVSHLTGYSIIPMHTYTLGRFAHALCEERKVRRTMMDALPQPSRQVPLMFKRGRSSHPARPFYREVPSWAWAWAWAWISSTAFTFRNFAVTGEPCRGLCQ